MKIGKNIEIHLGDCLEIMNKIPDGIVDLILTDPPYELSNHGGGNTDLAQRKLVKDGHINFISKGFDYDTVFSEYLRILKVPNILIFCSNKQVSKIMKFFEDKRLSTTLLVWNKTNPSPLCNGKHLSDIEFVVYVRGKGATFNNDTPFNYKRKVITTPIESNKNRLHPTQKPLEILEQYIYLHSKVGDLVFDSFMGSGSTAIACQNTKRRFIGCEINKEYFDNALDRIKLLSNQQKLF